MSFAVGSICPQALQTCCDKCYPLNVMMRNFSVKLDEQIALPRWKIWFVIQCFESFAPKEEIFCREMEILQNLNGKLHLNAVKSQVEWIMDDFFIKWIEIVSELFPHPSFYRQIRIFTKKNLIKNSGWKAR